MTRATPVAAASLLAALAIVLSAPSLPAQQPGPEPAQQDFPTDLYYVATPDQLIRQGIDRLAGFLTADPQASPQLIQAFLEREFSSSFDFQYMARWASGALHHRLDEVQKAALTARLRSLLLEALARNLGAIERPLPRVDVFPARPGHGINDAVVYARVWGNAGQTRLEFRFYWTGHEWKIYDAAANGSSAVAYYRRYFSTLLRQYGPEAVLR